MRKTPGPAKGFLIGSLYPPLVVGLMYLSGVKYTEVTDSASNVAKALVVPGLVMTALLVVLTSWLGWWQPVLREKVTTPRWLVAIPVLWVVAILIGTNYARVAQLSSAFLVWATIATLFIGFGEEMTYRGLSIVGLRGGMSEAKVWLLSSLMFGLAHSANIFLGQSVGDTAVQLVYAFVLGSLLYAIRRVTGLLVVAILMHAAWDWMLFVSQSKALADPGETLHGPSALPNVIAVVIAVVMVILFAIGARGLFRKPIVGANSA